MADPAGYIPFRLGKPRFDQTSFYGRFRHFLDIIDPRTLFVTESRLREAVQLLEDYKHGTLPPGVTNEEENSKLWHWGRFQRPPTPEQTPQAATQLGRIVSDLGICLRRTCSSRTLFVDGYYVATEGFPVASHVNRYEVVTDQSPGSITIDRS